MQATVRSISPVSKVFGIGLVPKETMCRVPANSDVVEMKYCEWCGLTFFRKRQSGERHCHSCHSSWSPEALVKKLLEEQEAYKAQHPNKRTVHIVKYDLSLGTPAPQNAPVSRKRRSDTILNSQIRETIVAAFQQRNRLDAEELRALYPGMHTRYSVMNRIRCCLRLKLILVDHVHPEGTRGSGYGVYVLEGVSKETLQ